MFGLNRQNSKFYGKNPEYNATHHYKVTVHNFDRRDPKDDSCL